MLCRPENTHSHAIRIHSIQKFYSLSSACHLFHGLHSNEKLVRCPFVPNDCNMDRRGFRNYWKSHFVSLKIISVSVAKQVYGLLFRSWMNILLLFVPTGIAMNALSAPLIAVLVVNFLAAVGLLGLGDAILRCITSRIGTKYGFLLYISARYVSAISHASIH